MTYLNRLYILLAMLLSFQYSAVAFDREGYTLLGQARYRYWGFNLYDAAFFQRCGVNTNSGNTAEGSALDENCSYILDLDYLRTFTPDNFKESSEKILKRVANENYDNIKGSFITFSDYFSTVGEGDRYTLKLTGEGVIELYLNGDLAGSVRDREFAEAYFAIWLSEDGINRRNAKVLRGSRG